MTRARDELRRARYVAAYVERFGRAPRATPELETYTPRRPEGVRPAL